MFRIEAGLILKEIDGNDNRNSPTLTVLSTKWRLLTLGEVFQDTQHIVSIRFCSQFYRSSATMIGFVRIRTILQQMSHTLFMTFLWRNAQCGRPLLTRMIGNSSEIQKYFHHFVITCAMQWKLMKFLSKHSLVNRECTLPSARMEWSTAIVIHSVHICVTWSTITRRTSTI